MEIRRLEQSEHGRTRKLYEQVFPEDSKAFVEYYYTWKTKDNIIYVAEDGDGIHAMVHLNPFLVSIGGKIQRLHYIVAVATEKEYRHQGLMRCLLDMAEQEMAGAGEKFTFLMPASEQIYLPFGYRFFGWQPKGILLSRKAEGRGLEIKAASVREAPGREAPEREAPGREASETEASAGAALAGPAVCRPVMPQEYDGLAQLVNRTLRGQYEVFIYRDRAYYERLCAEQQCQGGNVMVIVQGDKIIGTFCTAAEEADSGYALEIREIIFFEEGKCAALEALQAYVDGYGDCRAAGWQWGIFGETMKELSPQCPGAMGCGTAKEPYPGTMGCRTAKEPYPGAMGCGTAKEPYPGLEQARLEPLMMGKVPGAGVFSGEWEPGQVFINEVV